MAYEALTAYIQSIVKPNLNEEITGQNLQEVLLAIIQTLGAREFRGVATMSTNPGTPAGQAVYIASQPGTYQFFNNLLVENELCLFIWINAAWEKQTIIPLGHFCYIAWRNAPGDGFTLVPNFDRTYEAILVTHNQITTPVEANFEGLWRYRKVNGGVVIPKLNVSIAQYRVAGEPILRRDNVLVWWDADDDTFMQHNPEIWVFRKRNNLRRKLVSEVLGDEICSDPGFDNPAVWNSSSVNVQVFLSELHFDNAEAGEYVVYDAGYNLVVPYMWHELTFEVKNYVSGSIIASLTDGQSEEISANGVYTFRLRRSQQGAEIRFTAVGAGTTLMAIDNVSLKKIIRSFDISHKKKWCHEPHLNGIKYPGSAYWAGETNCKVAEIAEAGRNTEFTLYTGRNGITEVGIDPYEYFYAYHDTSETYYKLSDTSELDQIRFIEAAGSSRLSVGFRLAIVIDHPAVPGAKLIGELSDSFYLRAMIMRFSNQVIRSLLLRYRMNQIILKMY